MLATAEVVLEKALAFALGLFVLTVAFRGGNMDRIMYAAVVIAAVVATLAAVLFLVGWRERPRLSTAAVFFVVALLMLLADGMACLLPLSIDTWLSLPGRSYYRDVVAVLQSPGFDVGTLAVSVDPASTQRAIVALIPCLTIALAAQYLSRRSVLQLLGLFALVATIEAVIGLLQLGLGGAFVLDYAGHRRASGTFVNKNHFATLLAMALPLLVLRVTGQFTFFAPAGKANEVARVLWGAALAFVVAALVASMSRAGVAAGVVVAFLAATLAWRRKRSMPRPFLVVGAFLALLGALLAAYLGLNQLLAALSGAAFSDGLGSRAQMVMHTWRGIVELFPLGAGLGSYNIAFQRFQTEALTGFVEYAHNDYLQLLFETGVVGAVVVALIGVSAWRVLMVARRSTGAGLRVAPAIACLLSALAFAIHACFDFPAHIPGLAFCATLLFALALNPVSAQVGLRRGPMPEFPPDLTGTSDYAGELRRQPPTRPVTDDVR